MADVGDSRKVAFLLFDMDGDGLVTNKEASMLIRFLGCTKSEDQVDRILGSKAEFSFDEFLAVANSEVKPPRECAAAIEKAFEVFDHDGDGTVSVTELKHLVQNLGERLTPEEAAEILSAGNPDKNGNIAYKPFVAKHMSV